MCVDPNKKLTYPAVRSFLEYAFLFNKTAKPVARGGAIHAADTPAMK